MKKGNFSLKFQVFSGFKPVTFRSWGQRVIHLATEAGELRRKNFKYLKPSILFWNLVLINVQINPNLKEPGSNLSSGEGKKILRKSICFLVLLESDRYL